MKFRTLSLPLNRFIEQSKAFDGKHIIHECCNIRFSAEQQKILWLYERQIQAVSRCDQECPKLSFILEKAGMLETLE